MQIKKNDFIEIEFTGKSNNEIFDTTNPEEAKSIGLDVDVKPTIVSVGNEMLLKGLDEALEGKEIDKKYSVHLAPNKAFGKRDSKLIRTIPIRVFHEKEMNPVPGMVFQLDNRLVRILSVSGGRVIADFNNPLAGKDVDYDFKVLRIVDDIKDKINAIQDFFFRQRFEFSVDEANKKIIFKESKIKPIIDVFSNKFKTLSGFDAEVEEKKPEKKEKAEEKSPVHDENCKHEH
ncbi:MAG: peptidylprolyl isomerase [Candidatus Pacearchaeota archaeon]|jgi:FKBP-type peptidyl-prolyl cis-trans isomerase SlyD